MEESVKTIVSTVAQLAVKEFEQLRGLGGEVAGLRNELCTINALVRMQSEADEGTVNHFVREWMKQLREMGYNAQDCVDLYFLRVRSRPGDNFLVQWKRLLTTLWSRRSLASDIRDLRALTSSINEQHGRYGVSLVSELSVGGTAVPVQLPQVVSAASAGALRAADNDDDPSQQFVYVGNKDQAKKLADKVKALRNDDESDKQLKVFSIWGFGGLGKTTLAVKICQLLEEESPRQAKVSVSQTFNGKQDLQGLLRRLLRQIAQPKQTTSAEDSLRNIDIMDVSELEKRIIEGVASNRYQPITHAMYEAKNSTPVGLLGFCFRLLN